MERCEISAAAEGILKGRWPLSECGQGPPCPAGGGRSPEGKARSRIERFRASGQRLLACKKTHPRQTFLRTNPDAPFEALLPQASSVADKGMTLAGHRTNLAAGKRRRHGGRAAFRNLGGAIPFLRNPALPTLPPARKTSAPCRGGGASNGAEGRAAMRTQTRPSAAAKRRASPPGNLRCAGAFPTATFSRLPARFEPLCMEFQKFGRTAPPCHRAANIEGPAPGVARARFRQSGAILPAPEGRFTA